MHLLRHLFRKLSKDPASRISSIYGLTAFTFILVKNYLYALKAGDSLNDFYFYTISSLGFVIVTTVELYYLVKKNVVKIRDLNAAKDIVLNQLKLFFDRIPSGVVILDTNSVITNWNPAAEIIFGYGKNEVIGQNSFEFVISPQIQLDLEKHKDQLSIGKDISVTTDDNFTKNGNHITCDWRFTSLFDGNDKLVGLMGVANDITKKVQNEEELKMLLNALEQNPSSIVITSINGVLAYVNPKVTEITGYSREELIGKRPEQMFQSAKTRKDVNDIMVTTLNAGQVWKGELLNKKKSGELYWAAVTVAPVKDNKGNITHFVGIEEDITEKKLRDEQIRHSLLEKELMLKEIHHRVKNNLQIISSLLSLQSQDIKDLETKKLFNVSRDRIHSMSLVHRQLYETNDLTTIDFEKYADTLGKQLLLSYYGTKDRRTKINTKAPNIIFGIDTAIPCGLILNELLVKCIKHGFKGNGTGNIDVEIKELLNGRYSMTVADNRIGASNGLKNENEPGIGMQIVEALTLQLGGSINISNQHETKIEIEFEEASYAKRIEVN